MPNLLEENLDDRELIKRFMEQQQSARDEAAQSKLYAGLAEAGDTIGHGIAGATAPVDNTYYRNFSDRADAKVKEQGSDRDLIKSYMSNKLQGTRDLETARHNRENERIGEETKQATLAQTRELRNQTRQDKKNLQDEKRDQKLADVTVPDYDTVPGARPTKDDAKAVKEAVTARKNINFEMGELKNLVSQSGPEIGFGEARDRMSQRVQMVKMELKEMEKLGALTGPDVQALAQQIPDPTSFGNWWKPGASQKLMERFAMFNESLDNKLNNTASSRGYVARGGDKKKQGGGFTPEQEKGIANVMKKNNISRAEAVSALQDAGKL